MHDKIYQIFKGRLDAFLTNEKQNIYPASIPLKGMVGWSKDPVAFKDRLGLDYVPAQVGMTWGHQWDSAWFHFTAKVPKAFDGKELCLLINTGGETCLFDKDGCPLCGLTNMSVFDWMYVKDRYAIGRHRSGETIDIWAESGANGYQGINQPQPYEKSPAQPEGSFDAIVRTMELCVFDKEMYAFFLDMRSLYNLLEVWGNEDYRGKKLLAAMNKALDIYGYDVANAAEARQYLIEHVYCNHATDSALTACTIGHAHIDVGWLWPVRESIRKAARTYSNQLDLMERYPQYCFGGSQAELYRMTKEHYPALFEKIRRRVAEGRWEVQGGMWVEADCNIISGESMIRQILHGKNFFMDEFGVDVRTIWIPDVFGYSAAMPQIMLKAGCDYFLTQKISWSQVNTFPYHSFRWVGVDGSEVLTHFPPENTYNALCLPSQRIAAANRYQQADVSGEFMSLFGLGDGGGGPSEEYIERNDRIANLEGCPRVRYDHAVNFFRRLDEVRDELPVWNGELYLEYHRGTLTTQARTKRNNRKCEQALTQLEILASCLPVAKYPAKKLDEAWKTLLVNQFHDIIPGSSIGLVYKTTERQHAEILAMCREETRKAAEILFRKKAGSAVVVNTLPTVWQGCVELPEDWADCAVTDDEGMEIPVQIEHGSVIAYLDVPGTSFVTLRSSKGKAARAKTRKADGLVLENDLIRYTFNDQGQLVSALDLEENRELMTSPGNVLSLYNDRPMTYEAWDIDMYYPRDFKDIMPCVKAEAPVCGPARSWLRFTYATASSTMTQTVILYPGSTRLDFVTHADWHEARTMLRTAFPVDIHSSEATFDIQYAFARRSTTDNTSWDQAKFEAVGQRYADLSQGDYGVALLNDCKYGYRMKGSTLDLNLLRSPKNPDYNADQGEHDFTYSFYPHGGNHVDGGVPEMAAMLNRDVLVVTGYEAGKAEFPCCVVSNSVNMEVLKKAEKDNSRIVRLVETSGQPATAELFVSSPATRVSETDLMEWEHGRELNVVDGAVALSLKPFEIVTLRLE